MTTMDEMDRDPELAAALRGVYGDVPEPDWNAMRARASADAALPLARRRRGMPRAVRTLLPLAVAACVAAVALTALPHRAPPLTQADRAMVEEILELSVPGEVGALIDGDAADQALLRAVEAPLR
jgi:hypothetical protein